MIWLMEDCQISWSYRLAYSLSGLSRRHDSYLLNASSSSLELMRLTRHISARTFSFIIWNLLQHYCSSLFFLSLSWLWQTLLFPSELYNGLLTSPHTPGQLDEPFQHIWMDGWVSKSFFHAYLQLCKTKRSKTKTWTSLPRVMSDRVIPTPWLAGCWAKMKKLQSNVWIRLSSTNYREPLLNLFSLHSNTR